MAAVLAFCAALTTGCGTVFGSSGDPGPVTVLTWAPEKTGAHDLPGVPAMARAYGRWVNAQGGLGGRELRVLTCNERNDAVAAQKCARRAVDEDAVAVVGSYSQHDRAFLSTLEMAGIPYLGGHGVTPGEFNSTMAYPVNGGQPALMAGLGRQLADRCASVALVRPDTVAGDSLPPLFAAGLAEGGGGAPVDVRVAERATDYARDARRAVEGVGPAAGSGAPGGGAQGGGDEGTRGCVVAALGDRTRTFMDSFRRTGDHPSVRVAAAFGSVDQAVVDSTGGGSGPYEGAYVCGWYPVASDPRWKAMREVIREHAFDDNRVDPADAGVQTTWIAYTVLREVVASLDGGPVTARTVRAALDDGLRVDTGGLTPPLRWRYEDLLGLRDHPRVVNANVTFQTVRDGRLVSARRGFTDVTGLLEGAPPR
ncbi:ABC transporter substrate-binding protein [Streptomyces sp. JNUCC 64]